MKRIFRDLGYVVIRIYLQNLSIPLSLRRLGTVSIFLLQTTYRRFHAELLALEPVRVRGERVESVGAGRVREPVVLHAHSTHARFDAGRAVPLLLENNKIHHFRQRSKSV